LAVNPKQYTSDAYYWLSKHLVTDHSPKIQRHRKVIWLKNRQNWEYTPSEICCLPRVEQGALAIELMSFEGFNWTMLESMFARRKMYIKTRIEDALSDITRGSSLKVTWDNFKATTEAKKLTKKRKRCPDGISHIDEWNVCNTDEQRFRLLKQLQSKYNEFVFSSRGSWEFHLAKMCGTDPRVVKRIFASTTFISSILFRLEKYHAVKDFDSLRKVSEKIGQKISIMCYCGISFMNQEPWHIHHCHDCGQLVGVCHSGCNTDEPNSDKIMDWMWGPGLFSRIHVISADRYDVPFLKPEECKKCVVRKIMQDQ